MSAANDRKIALKKRVTTAARRRDKDKTVELILQAATRTFPELGYEGTSVDVVAQIAGVARRTVYNNFDSKEELFLRSVERLWQAFPQFNVVLRPELLEDPRAGLTIIGNGYARFPPATHAYMRVVIGEGPRFPELVDAFKEGGRKPARRTLSEYLSMLQDHGKVKIEDIELATEQFLGLISGPLLWGPLLTGVPSPADEERLRTVQSAVDIFLARYATGSGRDDC